MDTICTRRAVIRRGALVAGGLSLAPAVARAAPTPAARADGERAADAPPAGGALAAANLDFAFRLFGGLAAESSGGSVFISPLSVSIALQMVANGARGATAEAIARTLGLRGMRLAGLNRAATTLLRDLTTRDPRVDLAIADSLWMRNGLRVRAQFAQTLRSAYGAEVASLDFRDPAAAAAINSWVGRKTRGLIPLIVDAIPPSTLLYLINALYFKGDWAQPFPSANTRPQRFTLPGGATRQVPMMSTQGSYRHYKDAALEAIALPYGSGAIAMYILLPAPGTDLAAFARTLNPTLLTATIGKLTMQHGTVAMPRFTVSYGAGLVPVLSRLGMAVAFGPRADLSGMLVDTQAAISQVQHKAIMKVTEAGTTAAAVTAVIMATAVMASPFMMTVNRPFFCAIRDDATGTLLFMGSIINPQ